MVDISYSTAGFNDRDIYAALDAIAAAGFGHAEISAHHVSAPLVGAALRTFRSGLEERGIAAGTVHAPMRENVLGAPEEGWRAEKVQVLASYLRFAGAIGAQGVVIHPVPNPIFVPDPERPELPGVIAEATRRSLDELVVVAADAGVCILLENLPYDCSYPFLNMSELRPLVDEYPAAVLGLVVDTGHAWTIGNDPAEEIRTAGSRLRGTHLQDVDGEDPQDNHWVSGQGDLDWDSIRAALAEVEYLGLWTFEAIVGRRGESFDDLVRLTREVAAEWGL